MKVTEQPLFTNSNQNLFTEMVNVVGSVQLPSSLYTLIVGCEFITAESAVYHATALVARLAAHLVTQTLASHVVVAENIRVINAIRVPC